MLGLKKGDRPVTQSPASGLCREVRRFLLPQVLESVGREAPGVPSAWLFCEPFLPCAESLRSTGSPALSPCRSQSARTTPPMLLLNLWAPGRAATAPPPVCGLPGSSCAVFSPWNRYPEVFCKSWYPHFLSYPCAVFSKRGELLTHGGDGGILSYRICALIGGWVFWPEEQSLWSERCR